MPRDGAIILGDPIAKLEILRVACDKCGRKGHYPVTCLIEQRGRDGGGEPLSHHDGIRTRDLGAYPMRQR